MTGTPSRPPRERWLCTDPQHVRRKEDSLGTQSPTDLPLDSLEIREKFPTRPDYGIKGEDCELYANYIEFEYLTKPEFVLFEYALSVTPDAVGKRLGRVIQLFLEKMSGDVSTAVTDFRTLLITRKRFDIQPEKVEYRAEG